MKGICGAITNQDMKSDTRRIGNIEIDIDLLLDYGIGCF